MRPERIRQLNDKPIADSKNCVVYVMSRDQRVHDNHALAAAQAQALELGVPFGVFFCLMPSTGHRAREHYEFMLAGLREVEKTLEAKNIPFMMMIGDPEEWLGNMIHHLKPNALYFDFNPLRGPRKLHDAIAKQAECAVFEVDAHNIVPAWQASDKQEFGARTLRTKIHKQLADYLADEAGVRKHPHDWPGRVMSYGELKAKIGRLLDELPSNGSDISRFEPGEKAAVRALNDFLDRLGEYGEHRNDPVRNAQSDLSPYLHFGQISSAQVVRAVEETANKKPRLRAGADELIEEMVIRKELSDNYCFYNPNYDNLKGAPEWAQRTLAKHKDDEREFTYTLKELEAAQTHDPAWNAAQLQMMKSGKMHNYLRMYWAKKVLEWSKTPETAIKNLIYLNDFYSIDGGDPNGYVGLLWSVAGLHDRPWGERKVYGTVRSMVYAGLKRKFDIKAYEDRWLIV